MKKIIKKMKMCTYKATFNYDILYQSQNTIVIILRFRVFEKLMNGNITVGQTLTDISTNSDQTSALNSNKKVQNPANLKISTFSPNTHQNSDPNKKDIFLNRLTKHCKDSYYKKEAIPDKESDFNCNDSDMGDDVAPLSKKQVIFSHRSEISNQKLWTQFGNYEDMLLYGGETVQSRMDNATTRRFNQTTHVINEEEQAEADNLSYGYSQKYNTEFEKNSTGQMLKSGTGYTNNPIEGNHTYSNNQKQNLNNKISSKTTIPTNEIPMTNFNNQKIKMSQKMIKTKLKRNQSSSMVDYNDQMSGIEENFAGMSNKNSIADAVNQKFPKIKTIFKKSKLKTSKGASFKEGKYKTTKSVNVYFKDSKSAHIKEVNNHYQVIKVHISNYKPIQLSK